MNSSELWPEDGYGPPIIMDAQLLARVPLGVKRRIFPEADPWGHASECLEALYPAQSLGGERWTIAPDMGGSPLAVFWLCDYHGSVLSECPACDGGEFYHEGHYYECKSCDGSGYSDADKESHVLAEAIVNVNGNVVSVSTK